jgi:uncharacterized protein (DUF433 family)
VGARGGDAPETVATEFDLDIADVHCALAYYPHPDEMAEWRARRDERIRESREHQFERNSAL